MRLLAAVAVYCAAVGSLLAQDGGLHVPFCDGDNCSDDSLEIVFASGTSTYVGPIGPGVEFPIRVVIDAQTPTIEANSFAVKHDPESLELVGASVTTQGSIVDPHDAMTSVRGANFQTTNAVEGGFISAVTLSILDDAFLPLGRNTLCRAGYRFKEDPECTVIRFAPDELANGPPVDLVFT